MLLILNFSCLIKNKNPEFTQPKIIFYFWSLVLFTLFYTTHTTAQQSFSSVFDNEIISIKHFSFNEGLNARQISCAVEDKNGFMWFASKNGLYRYDGNQFKLFTKHSFGLLNNNIFKLTVDEDNHLFVHFITNNNEQNYKIEIQVLDLNTYTFCKLSHVFARMPFKAERIINIQNDSQNNLYFFTSMPFEIWKLDKNKLYTKCLALPGSAIESRQTLDIYVYTINNPILTNQAQLINFIGHPSYYCYSTELPKNYKEIIAQNAIFTKCNTYVLYNSITNQKRIYTIPTTHSNQKSSDSQTKNTNSLSNIKWRYIANKTNKDYIKYEATQGVYFVHNSKEKLVLKSTEYFDKTNFGVVYLYTDVRGDNWLCTTEGIYQLRTNKNYFTQYFTRAQDSSIINNQIRGIYLDHNRGKHGQTIYANTWSDFCYAKPQTKTKTHIRFNNQLLYSFLKKDKLLYLGGYSVNIFDTQTESFQNFYDKQDSEIWSMALASKDKLFLGRTNGIELYSIANKTKTRCRSINAKWPKPYNVYRFIQLQNKQTLAVAENGVYRLDQNQKIVEYWGKFAKDKLHYLPCESIYDLLLDQQGNWWIATNGEGLFCCLFSSKLIPPKIIQYTINDGLSDMVLFRMELDQFHNLWIGTYNGLTRFNTKTHATAIYTTKDGLSHNEFNRISSFKDLDGNLYFGGMDGINSFNPAELVSLKYSKEPNLQLLTAEKFVDKQKKFVDCIPEFKRTKKIEFSPGTTVLNVQFQLLDFEQRRHQYAYKLEGSEGQWNYIEQNSLRLSGLAYGNYNLQIKAQLDNGQWSKKIITIPLQVLKPFYFETWFIVLGIFLILAFILGIIRYRTKKFARENLKLELKVANRTIDLKKALSDKELLLAEIHHRVKNNLQIISGLLEMQKEQLADENAKKALTEGQTRVNSIALIHHNLYQNDHFGEIEFSLFIQDLVSKVAEMFENQQRKVRFNINNPVTYLPIDTAIPMGLVVNELITNTYKHAVNPSTDTLISIQISTKKEGYYELLYQDNGPGFLSTIFETTSSLGFRLVKGLTQQIGGTVNHSNENGTVFTIQFSIQK